MKISRQQSLMIGLAGIGGLAVVGLFAFFIIQLPGLQTLRTSIDNTRANAAYVSDQQMNLQALKRQLTTLSQQQQDLNSQIWKFADEESFFTRWDSFGPAHHVTVELSNVADVVPGTQPVARTVVLSISGALSDVLDSLRAIQTTQPLIAIQSVTLQPGADSAITASVNATTIWQ